MQFIGIDLRTNKFTRSYRDEATRADANKGARAETFALDAAGMTDFYKTLTPDAYVLVEATVTTFSFARLVQPMVKELIVANTHELKQISLARVNTDKTDAHILSRILKMLALSGEQAAFSASVPPPEISVFIAIAVIADIISVERFRRSKAFASCLLSAPKGLSLNNLGLAKSNKRAGEHRQAKVARSHLLEPDKQLAKPIHPGMRGLHHPPASLAPPGLPAFPSPLPLTWGTNPTSST